MTRFNLQVKGQSHEDMCRRQTVYTWENAVMKEAPEGEWVQFSAVQSEIEALKRRIPEFQFQMIEEKLSSIAARVGVHIPGTGPR